MRRESQYKADQKLESMAAAFLDRNFYSMFGEKAMRHADTYHQYGGIDVTIGKANFDEKLKVYGCLNQVLAYPSFEVQFIDRAGYIRDGWFVDSSLSTDYYAYISISSSVSSESELTSQAQISAADVLWLKKSDILDFVQQHTPLSAMKEDADNLRCQEDYITLTSKIRKTYDHKKFWLTYSIMLDEKPVNLVMPRKSLEALPHSKHFIVYEGKVVKA